MSILAFELEDGHWFFADPENTHIDAFGEERTVGVLFDILLNKVQYPAHVSSNIETPLFDKVRATARHLATRVLTVHQWTGRRWELFLICGRR